MPPIESVMRLHYYNVLLPITRLGHCFYRLTSPFSSTRFSTLHPRLARSNTSDWRHSESLALSSSRMTIQMWSTFSYPPKSFRSAYASWRRARSWARRWQSSSFRRSCLTRWDLPTFVRLMSVSTQSARCWVTWSTSSSKVRRSDYSNMSSDATCGWVTTYGTSCILTIIISPSAEQFHSFYTHSRVCTSAREALRACLPEPLRDATFSQVLKGDLVTKRCLASLLLNLSDRVE